MTGLITFISLTSFAQTNGWLVRKSPVNEHLYGAAHGNGNFVAVGNHETILSSPDGLTWKVRRHRPFTAGDPLNAVTFAAGTFVAVGGSANQILTSKDGLTWNVARHAVGTLWGVTYGNGRFVAVGEGPILFSGNGSAWQRATNSDATFKAVAFGNNTFVAVGESGAVATSGGGRRWTSQSVAFPANTTLEAIAFNGSEFVVSAREMVDTTTELIHSYRTADGVTWAEAPPPPFFINAYAIGNEGVLGVGDSGDGTGRTQISPDAITWPGEPFQVSRQLYGATFGERRYVAVGRRGMILQSRPALDVINFDLSRDFSLSSNPNGPWSYGYEGTLGTNFTLITHSEINYASNGVPIEVWDVPDTFPAVMHNGTTATAYTDDTQGIFPPGTVWFYPGASTSEGGFEGINYGVIRLTIPEGGAGNYDLRTTVQSAYNGPIAGDTDFHVLVNGTEVFGKSLLRTGVASYETQLALVLGDTVDFVIGRGADDSYHGSGLKITATLVQVP